MSENMIGHNSATTTERLKSIVDRIEKLEEQKANLGCDIKDIYAEAKGTGFDVAIIRKVIREKKMEIEKLRENQELLDLYRSALGLDI